MAAELEYTRHAANAIAERAISAAWVERVMDRPALRQPGPNDPEVERFFAESLSGVTER